MKKPHEMGKSVEKRAELELLLWGIPLARLLKQVMLRKAISPEFNISPTMEKPCPGMNKSFIVRGKGLSRPVLLILQHMEHLFHILIPAAG